MSLNRTIKDDVSKNPIQKNITIEKDKMPIKKKPGRPRKNPIIIPNPRLGISDTPKDKSNVIEFEYDAPTIFKKLWTFYKAMAVEKIQIIYRKEEVIIWGEDHHKKSKIYTRIDAKKINHYYCEEPFNVGILCSNLQKVMFTIDKSYTNISLVCKKGYQQKNMMVNFTTVLEIKKNHTIELIGDYSKMCDEEQFFDPEYQIKFDLPSKYFKKMITDLKSFSELTIKQDSIDDPLIFEYISKDTKIKSEDVVTNNDKINFTSNLQGDDTFRTSFRIDYIKPISSAVLSKNISILVHEDKPLLFNFNIDNGTFMINILTEIIDDRNINLK